MLAIRAAANKIIAKNGSTFQVTRLQTQRQFKRNKKQFKTLQAKTLAQERKAAYRKEDLEEHFKEYYGALKKFGITFKDVYNIDETSFRIGVLNKKIIITYLQTKAIYLANLDNRESLTTIETIYKDNIAIIPFLILKREVLKEDYFKNDLNDETILATSASSYINKQLSIKYIKHFYN